MKCFSFIFLFLLAAPLVAEGPMLREEFFDTVADFADDNDEVMESLNRLVTKWETYQSNVDENFNTKGLFESVVYAAQMHEGQVRKNVAATPYIVHPIGVAELLWDVGGVRNWKILAAGLLHDTLEDTEASEWDIEELFGKKVLSIVQEVTNDPDLDSEENKWRQIEHAPNMSMEAQLVKLADRLYNVRDLSYSTPEGWSEEKVAGYYRWGERLLAVLGGVNRALEEALAGLVEDYLQEI